MSHKISSEISPKNKIPVFPGKIMQPPPKPPKYLIATGLDGKETKIANDGTKNSKLSEPKAPPSKSIYFSEMKKSSVKVDSRYDVKSTPIPSHFSNISGTEIDPNTNLPRYLGNAPPKSFDFKSSTYERSKLALIESGLINLINIPYTMIVYIYIL